MKLKKLNNRLKPLCAKCPYKLGLVSVTIHPCPQCERNGYDFYERLLKQQWQGKIPDCGGK